MRVVILARTKMGEGVCIGGMVEETGQPVRPLPPKKHCHPPSAPYQVGDVWEMDLRPRPHIEPPHVEDHDAWPTERVGQHANLLPFLRQHVRHPWRGAATSLFNGTLRFRSKGTAYLHRVGAWPVCSVGFWVLPAALIHIPKDDCRHFFLHRSEPRFRIPYVGSASMPPTIAAGTLVRVSMARWWLNPKHAAEGETCALQLSGWYPPDAVSPHLPSPP